MLLKSSRILGTRTNGSSDPQIRNNQSMRKMALTNSLLKTSPSHRKRRVTGRRRTPENGVISTKSPSTTPMNFAQNSHWWPRSKTRSQTLIQNLIQKILMEDISSTQTPLLLSWLQQFNQKRQHILKRGSTFFIHRCGWRGSRCILLLIAEARRTSSQQRFSNIWDFRQHHTHNHTTSGGFARDAIFVSTSSVDCHKASNPSRMRYYVMFPHWMCVLFSWASHICVTAMLFMSLDFVVSLLLWEVISTEYQR